MPRAQVWAPRLLVAHATGGPFWLPFVDATGTFHGYLPESIVRGLGDVLRGWCGVAQADAAAAPGWLRELGARVGRDLHGGWVVAVLPGEVAIVSVCPEAEEPRGMLLRLQRGPLLHLACPEAEERRGMRLRLNGGLLIWVCPEAEQRRGMLLHGKLRRGHLQPAAADSERIGNTTSPLSTNFAPECPTKHAKLQNKNKFTNQVTTKIKGPGRRQLRHARNLERAFVAAPAPAALGAQVAAAEAAISPDNRQLQKLYGALARKLDQIEALGEQMQGIEREAQSIALGSN
ncbi:hypothetical protein EJB05_45367, partial [Eragrostis curvula]